MRVIRCTGPINDKLERANEQQRLSIAADQYFTQRGMPNAGSKISKGIKPLSKGITNEK